MNCQAVRNKILSLEDPRHVPGSLRDHVTGCGACRVWAEQASRLEDLLERLPTPPAPADKKAAFLADLARGTVVAEPEVDPAPRRSFAEALRQNAALVGGLAAALMVALGAWLLNGGNGTKPGGQEVAAPRSPFLDRMVQRNVELAKANTPAEKFRILGAWADDFPTEARSLARAASAEELKDVARWYDKVVNAGLVKQARELAPAAMTPAEKQAQFKEIARQLGASADEMKRAAGEVPPEAKPILERIADTARDGQKKMTELAGKV